MDFAVALVEFVLSFFIDLLSGTLLEILLNALGLGA